MDGIVKEARDAAEAAYSKDRYNRVEGLKDLQFLGGDQWDPADRKAREADDRPCLTVNRLIGPVKQVINGIRQATPAVKVQAIDKDSDVGTGMVLGGLIRQVQRVNRASWVYAMATGHAAACGIGHFRINTRYADEDTFEQEVGIELIPHPFSVLWDPASAMPVREDANHCLVLEFMPRTTFEATYPGKKASDFGVAGAYKGGEFLWYSSDVVVIAEYWRKVAKSKKIGLTETGAVIDLTNIKALPTGLRIVREREVKSFDVHQTLVSGCEQLTETVVWPGRHIPIIPVIGNEIPLEKETIRHGMVRFARDPQRMSNYWRSASAEWINQGLKSPIIATNTQIENYLKDWKVANKRPMPYLLYDIDPENPQAAPTRQAPPSPPQAFWQEGEITAEEIRVTTGVHEANMGQRSNETSAKAIGLRRAQGETTNFEFADNLSVSLQHAGAVMADLIPNVYDTQRTVLILDEVEREQFVPINVTAYTHDGRPVMVHDLSAGKYRVAITVGPSHATRRQEATESMSEFIKSSPDLLAVSADLVAEGMDWPNATKFAERFKRLVPPEILGEEAEPQEPDPLQQEAAMLDLKGKAAEVANIEADTLQKRAKAKAELIKANETEWSDLIELSNDNRQSA